MIGRKNLDQLAKKTITQLENVHTRIDKKQKNQNERLKGKMENQNPDYHHLIMDFNPRVKDHENQVTLFDGTLKYKIHLSWSITNWTISLLDLDGNSLGNVRRVTSLRPLRHIQEYNPRYCVLSLGGETVGTIMLYHGRNGDARHGLDLDYNGWQLQSGKKMNEFRIDDSLGNNLVQILFGKQNISFLGVKHEEDEPISLLIVMVMLADRLERGMVNEHPIKLFEEKSGEDE